MKTNLPENGSEEPLEDLIPSPLSDTYDLGGIPDIVVTEESADLPPKPDTKKAHTAIAIHTVNQLYGDSKQLSLFSIEKTEEFIKSTGLGAIVIPKSYGMVLNQSQHRVFEAILKAFSDTNYKGNEQIDKSAYPKRTGYPINKMPEPYSNVNSIPVLHITQAELISLAGYDLKKQRQGDKVDVKEALYFLGQKQFCFYWVRLQTENGVPVKDKNGDYKKEGVLEVSTLFRVKIVFEDQSSDIKYYEIHPSAVILDQVNSQYGGNYFLLVPLNWRDEVHKLTGKRASSYTYEFLLWLRLQYEHIRRHNSNHSNKRAFKLKKTWEEIAITLKMPESMYKINRKRAITIIQEAYNIAIKLGYLTKVENTETCDILYLNDGYYPKPGELV
ncbi:MAG: hypothetical protein V4543_17925 [Bacteroidota bacterium]